MTWNMCTDRLSAFLDPNVLEDVLQVHSFRRRQELRQDRTTEEYMQVLRGSRELGNAPSDAHKCTRAEFPVLLHRVGSHARAIPVSEAEQGLDDGRGAACLEEDVRLLCVRHRLCGHGEEHVRVFVAEPVLERERLGGGADHPEGWVGYGEVGRGLLRMNRFNTARLRLLRCTYLAI